VARGSLAAAKLKGMDFRIAAEHGWRPSGQPFVITKACGEKVLEIDGRPAWERYRQLIGEITPDNLPRSGMEHPLGFPLWGGDFLIRDPFLTEEDGSIRFVSEVPEDSIAFLMESDEESLLKASRKAVKNVVGPDNPRVLLIFECVSRYFLLKEVFHKEMGNLSAFTGTAPLFGLLTFGEILGWKGVPLFYNKTITVAAGW